MSQPRELRRADYTVGWICALPNEMVAAKGMLDEVHQDQPVRPNDYNSYTLGRIGQHNVVIACLPRGEYGSASASAVAMQLLSSFQSIRFGLLVGIGGGIPSKDVDIRLGDVVVGIPTSGTTHGGVIQYDLGKATSVGKFERTGILNRPPQILLTAVSKLQAIHQMEGSHISDTVDEFCNKYPRLRKVFGAHDLVDQLCEANYHHRSSRSSSFRRSKLAGTINRPQRAGTQSVIHYGPIASGNQVVKDSNLRDCLGRDLGAYCVEMEAAGLVNHYPCLVIRGICDYADSHKNKDWQGYAALTAAAYAKELLLVVSSTSLDDQGQGEEVKLTGDEIMLLKQHPCMQSLRPSDIEIPRPASKNEVEWENVFDNLDFAEWYSGRNQGSKQGLIWIKGKPGSGKTTFMKYAFSRAAEHMRGEGTSVACFFLNRSDNRVQWSPLSLLEAILYQLLQACQDDLARFVDRFGHKLQTSESQTTWSEDELKSYLEVMFSRPRSHRTVLFLDGLDDCTDNGIRELAFFFRELTTTAHAVSGNLSICLCSREYPKVTIGNCPEVLVHQLNTSDIQRYITRTFKAAGLNQDPKWLRLGEKVISRSAGVFLWVVLVLNSVLKDYDEGLSFGYIQRRLNNIPPELEQLYEQIISTVDQADHYMTLRFFYWVLLPVKPLRLVEWHHILAWIRDPPPSSLQEWRNSDYFTETDSQLERRIQHLSKGLVEVKSKEAQLESGLDDTHSILGDAGSLDSEEGETRIVRIIHGSVREFFLRGPGFHRLDPSLAGGVLGPGNLSILGTCLDYISIPELDALFHRRRREHDNRPKQAAIKPSSVPESPKHRNVERRAGNRRKRTYSEASFGSSASNYADSMHSGHYTFERSPEPTERLPILETHGANYPILPGPSDSSFVMDQYLRDSIPPVEPEALERTAGMVESLQSRSPISQTTLEDHPALLFYTLNSFRAHIKCADHHGVDPKSLICRLQTGGLWQRWLLLADVLPADTSMLCFAASKGLTLWVNYFLDVGLDTDCKVGIYDDALEAAVHACHAEITRILLQRKRDEGEDLDIFLRGVAIRMVEKGNTDELLWLLDVSFTGDSTSQELVNIDLATPTLLLLAIRRGYTAVIRKLLATGVNLVQLCRNGVFPLHQACDSQRPDIHVCQALLDHGMDREARNKDGLIPSQVALRNNFIAGVSLLNNYEPHSSRSQPKVTFQVTEILAIETLSRPYIMVYLAGRTKILHRIDGTWNWNKVQFCVPQNTLLTPEFVMRDIRPTRDYRVRYTAWHTRYLDENETERAFITLDDEGGREFPLLETPISVEVTLEITVPSRRECRPSGEFIWDRPEPTNQ